MKFLTVKRILLSIPLMMSHFTNIMATEDMPPENCLVDEQALKDCYDREVITKKQFKNWQNTAIFNGKRSASERALQKYNLEHFLFRVPQRCEHDSVEQTNAPGRVKWSQGCVPNQNESTTSFLKALETQNQDGRPLYVTFLPRKYTMDGKVTSISGVNYKAPVKPGVSCNLPEDYRIGSVCVSGCYAAGEEVLSGQGYRDVAQMNGEATSALMTLSSGSNLDDIKWKQTPLKQVVSSLAESAHRLIEVTTQANRHLRVTENHPLVLFTGEVVAANTLKVGEELVDMSGHSDKIVQVKSLDYFGRVHNVALASTDRAENIVAANGLLNGSIFYQNEAAFLLNQKLFRINIDVAAIQQKAL